MPVTPIRVSPSPIPAVPQAGDNGAASSGRTPGPGVTTLVHDARARIASDSANKTALIRAFLELGSDVPHLQANVQAIDKAPAGPQEQADLQSLHQAL
ncbi:MAG: hypothetical protein ACRYGK_02765 [Janthinobacterium lividum]